MAKKEHPIIQTVTFFEKGRQNKTCLEATVNSTIQRRRVPCNSKKKNLCLQFSFPLFVIISSSHSNTKGKKKKIYLHLLIWSSIPLLHSLLFSLGPTCFLYCTVLAKRKHNHMAFGGANSKSSRHFVSLGHPSTEQMWILCWIPKELQGVTKKRGKEHIIWNSRTSSVTT